MEFPALIICPSVYFIMVDEISFSLVFILIWIAHYFNRTIIYPLRIKKIVKIIEKKTEIEVLAIGIRHDVSRYYNRAIKITDVNELGDVMISQLGSLFDAKKKLH